MAFPEEVVAGVCGYMNANQADNNLLIAKVLGGEQDITAARMVGFDEEAVLFAGTVIEGEVEVRVPWTHRAETRDDVKDRLFGLVDKALAAWDGSDL